MTRIILTADDFGRSKERNRAIDDAFKQGLITSAGLIVTGEDLSDAIEYINKGGYAEKVHLHMNFSTSMRDIDSEDIPLTSAVREDSLLCKNGRFKRYGKLPIKFSSILKWRKVYREMIAQYELFRDVTGGQADYAHIDFHMWFNMTWPASFALALFTRKYHIRSVRYIGLHHTDNKRYRLFRKLSWDPRVKAFPATNIDYFLSFYQDLDKDRTYELYCHPNYQDGIFLDDSPSYLGHERQPMLQQIERLKELGDIEFVSWKEI